MEAPVHGCGVRCDPPVEVPRAAPHGERGPRHGPRPARDQRLAPGVRGRRPPGASGAARVSATPTRRRRSTAPGPSSAEAVAGITAEGADVRIVDLDVDARTLGTRYERGRGGGTAYADRERPGQPSGCRSSQAVSVSVAHVATPVPRRSLSLVQIAAFNATAHPTSGQSRGSRALLHRASCSKAV